MIVAYSGKRELPVVSATTAALSASQRANAEGILTTVAAHLQAESAAFADVHATLTDDIVILTGTVRSQALKRHAGELTYTVPGVMDVQNKLTVVSESNAAHRAAEKEQPNELV